MCSPPPHCIDKCQCHRICRFAHTIYFVKSAAHTPNMNFKLSTIAATIMYIWFSPHFGLDGMLLINTNKTKCVRDIQWLSCSVSFHFTGCPSIRWTKLQYTTNRINAYIFSHAKKLVSIIIRFVFVNPKHTGRYSTFSTSNILFDRFESATPFLGAAEPQTLHTHTITSIQPSAFRIYTTKCQPDTNPMNEKS